MGPHTLTKISLEKPLEQPAGSHKPFWLSPRTISTQYWRGSHMPELPHERRFSFLSLCQH